MKKIIPLFILTLSTLGLFGQCDELFISEYVHGFGNNRALEIYNPTNAAIDLSAYSIGRFSNGETTYKGIDLPADILEPYDSYVIVIDKRDSLGTGFDLPVWNGYQQVEPRIDSLTGEVILNSMGDTIYDVVYDLSNGAIPVYGTVYHDFVDLEGKADVFLCPVYNINQAMYFNGNDAVALVKGSTINNDGSNLLDVIGVIGEDPGDDIGWLTNEGYRLTYRRTLERNADVKVGTGPIVAATQDTFAYVQYYSWWNNYFDGLGEHDCECDPDFMTSNENINQIPFNMYPNPTSNELWVEAELNIEQVEIFNILGERVFFQNFGTGASNKMNIKVNDFKTGMYVVNLSFTGDQHSIKKFIKR